MHRRGMWVLFGSLAPVAAVACDAQPTSDYQGEKLATLRGTVTSQVGAAASADFALMYSKVLPTDWSELHYVQRVPVKGDFPSQFTIERCARPAAPPRARSTPPTATTSRARASWC